MTNPAKIDTTAARALEGRSAIVTGASRGIGRAIAERFAANGARVIVAARSTTDLDEVVGTIAGAGGTAVAVTVDVTADDAAERIVTTCLETFGALDILVNNAGGNSFMTPIADLRFAGWRKAMALNVDSALRLIQAALPALGVSRHASIVNVASVTALRGSPLLGHYGAAKAALVSLTQSLAIEVAADSIRANALVPGWVETDLTAFARSDAGVESTLIDRVPMRRWGRPDEIADAALFLAGDASSYMTGQCLVIDGGLSAQP